MPLALNPPTPRAPAPRQCQRFATGTRRRASCAATCSARARDELQPRGPLTVAGQSPSSPQDGHAEGASRDDGAERPAQAAGLGLRVLLSKAGDGGLDTGDLRPHIRQSGPHLRPHVRQSGPHLRPHVRQSGPQFRPEVGHLSGQPLVEVRDLHPHVGNLRPHVRGIGRQRVRYRAFAGRLMLTDGPISHHHESTPNVGPRPARARTTPRRSTALGTACARSTALSRHRLAGRHIPPVEHHRQAREPHRGALARQAFVGEVAPQLCGRLRRPPPRRAGA